MADEPQPEGEEPEVDAEFVPEEPERRFSVNYEVPEFVGWASSPEQQCRAFIFQWFATGEVANYDAAMLVANMDAVFQWLHHGTVVTSVKGRAHKLRAVPSETHQ
jgi:hypothetical protein